MGKTLITEFFKDKGITNISTRRFVKFLMENNAYIEFVEDLSHFLDDEAMTAKQYHEYSKWCWWVDGVAREADIINRFLIWDETRHEELWRELHKKWYTLCISNYSHNKPF